MVSLKKLSGDCQALSSADMAREAVDNPDAVTGKRIRLLRQEHGLTQERLAYESGIAKGHLSKIERGLQSPRLTTLRKLAARLEVQVVDLVIDPENELRHQLIDAARRSPDRVLDALNLLQDRETPAG